jgi:glucose/arabinose dehydrogenase
MTMLSKIGIGIGIVAVVLAGVFYLYAPTFNIPPNETPKGELGEPVSFLKVPEGFVATYYAKNIPGARVIEWAPNGGLVVSQTKEGKISLVRDADNNGTAETVTPIIENLDSPHGITFDCQEDPCSLYVATQSKLLRYTYGKDNTVSNKTELLTFPASATDRHKTRTIMFLPVPYENTLLISVGSSCNVCNETDAMRGKIIAYNTKTKEVTDFAKGLRNSVFMTLNPVNGIVFATEMGRDGLGDDLPPDEVNMIEPARVFQQKAALNFGWPICYGKNIHDAVFDKNTYIRNPCMDGFEMPAWTELPAHSAPLGLSFIPEEGWPEEWWFDLVVAYHGSWNRSVPTGYKLVKMSIDGRANPSEPEDFITGWLTPDGKKLGRPVDVKILPGGSIYISDDQAGVIYKVQKLTE